ncbi:MAG: hypothetical protein LBF38_10295 [Deltaproteobacteria bacterium]|nr:hypothetical protein [Deltaproteobacteria bacterium]
MKYVFVIIFIITSLASNSLYCGGFDFNERYDIYLKSAKNGPEKRIGVSIKGFQLGMNERSFLIVAKNNNFDEVIAYKNKIEYIMLKKGDKAVSSFTFNDDGILVKILLSEECIEYLLGLSRYDVKKAVLFFTEFYNIKLGYLDKYRMFNYFSFDSNNPNDYSDKWALVIGLDKIDEVIFYLTMLAYY